MLGEIVLSGGLDKALEAYVHGPHLVYFSGYEIVGILLFTNKVRSVE